MGGRNCAGKGGGIDLDAVDIDLKAPIAAGRALAHRRLDAAATVDRTENLSTAARCMFFDYSDNR